VVPHDVFEQSGPRGFAWRPGPFAERQRGDGMSTALVLGGGGITGIAWEVGVLAGLARAGVDLSGADLIIGTSAGSVVGTLVASGVELETMVAGQRETPVDGMPPIDIALAMQAFGVLADTTLDRREARARVGALALAAEVGDEEEQVARFAAGMPQDDWPARRLVVTGVDALTGDPVAWDRGSGVPLVRAVTASCAVPCVFPPVTVNGRRYIDGGVRSGTNADLATGATEIVVIAPMAHMSPLGAPRAELDALRETSSVTLIGPDEPARTAIGQNVLDPGRRQAALDAGLAQGESLARDGALRPA
jgi:NTE family protein